MAVIDGTIGPDNLNDTNGDDTITAQAGDDTITVSQGGTDSVDGGDDNDRLVLDVRTLGGAITMAAPTQNVDGLSGSATWNSTSLTFQKIEHFTIYSSTGDSVDDVVTGGGDDVFHHYGINSLTYAEDTIDLGAGYDQLVADFSAISSYSITSTVPFAGGYQLLVNGGGKVLASNIEAVHMIGGGQADTVTGLSGDDNLDGRGGDDTLSGAAGLDILNGGDGNDSLNGGSGDDSIFVTQGGTDTIDGGSEDDRLFLDARTLGGGISMSAPTQNVDGLSGSASWSGTTVNFQRVEAFTIYSSAGNFTDLVTTGGGDDVFYHYGLNSPSYLRDDIDLGGGSNDLVVGDFTAVTDFAVTIQPEPGYDFGFFVGGNGKARIINAERISVIGGAQGDTLTGLAGSDILDGRAGNDVLNGAGGDDIIDGGDGDDDLSFTAIANVAEQDSIDGGDGDLDTLHADFSASSTGVVSDEVAFTSNPAGGHDGRYGTPGGFATTANLIVNPGAEDGASAPNFTSTVTPQGWTAGGGGFGTAVDYAAAGPNDLNADDSTAIGGGSSYFAGGPAGSATSTLTQTIDVSAHAAAIDVGDIVANLDGWLGGWENQDDNSVVTIRFLGASAEELGTASIGPVLSEDRGEDSSLVFRSTVAAIPVGTRSIEVVVTFTDDPATSGSYNDGYVDNLSLTLSQTVHAVDFTGIERFVITGSDHSDSLVTGAGNDEIDGGAGDDTLTGGGGNDLYIVDSGADVIVESSGGGTDTVESSATYTLADQVENLTLTGASPINGAGNALANVITGNSTANTLAGGGGNDTLDGGAGGDLLVGSTGNDVYLVDQGSGGGNVGVDSDDFQTSEEGWALVGGGTPPRETDAGFGTILGRFGNNATGAEQVRKTFTLDPALATTKLQFDFLKIDSWDRDDFVDGPSNNTEQLNVYIGGTLAFSFEPENNGEGLDGATGTFTVGAITGSYVVTSSGTNTHIGFNGSYEDRVYAVTVLLNGAGGSVTIGFGASVDQELFDEALGIDNVVVTQLVDVVAELADEGTDEVRTSTSAYTLGDHVENLTGLLDTGQELTGNALANIINGGDGNDVIDGGDGIDTLNGGDGNDTLDGGAGNDKLRGNAGDDTYIITSAGEQITELAGNGTDTVQSSATYTLGAELENLVLTGASAINGTGNGLDNEITGNNAANFLSGGAGADTMSGLAGDDTYVVDNVGDQAIEASGGGLFDLVRSSVGFTLGDHVERLLLTGTAAIDGTGNDLANVLTGNSGANRIDGGLGADKMVGKGGNDTYVIERASDTIIEDSGAGTDTAESSVTYTLASNVENLVLTGAAAINGTGNFAANTITGNGAANTLNGLAGADTMIGGGGNDIYFVDNAGDTVTELSGGGTDLVRSNVTHTLGAEVENLTLTGGLAINGTGNGLVNVITGNAGANTLDGGIGADKLNGKAGNDTYIVDDLGDQVSEDAATGGTDLVQSSVTFTLGLHLDNLTLTGANAINGTGNATNNVITGNTAANDLRGLAGSDALSGGDGDDDLRGGLGNDDLTGGSGIDDFIFDTALGASNVDDVLDFVVGVDEIKLENAVFTGLAAGALSATAFKAGTAATDADDRIIYDAATGRLWFDSDGTGAAAQVLFADLNNAPAGLSASDFTVI